MVWAGTETLIKGDNLTSTAGVGLGGTGFNYTITNDVQTPKRPSTAVTADVSQVRQDFNNAMSLNGVIDARNTTSTSGGKVSWALLEDFAESTDAVYVKDEVFTGGEWWQIIIKSVQANRNPGASDKGYLVNYTMVIIRT